MHVKGVNVKQCKCTLCKGKHKSNSGTSKTGNVKPCQCQTCKCLKTCTCKQTCTWERNCKHVKNVKHGKVNTRKISM